MPAGILPKKTRKFTVDLPTTSWTTNSGKSWQVTPGSKYPAGSQRTDSIGHTPNRKTGKYESGGPFYSVCGKLSFPTVSYDRSNVAGTERVITAVGTPMPDVNSATDVYQNAESIRSSDLSDLDPFGATAIAQSAPTNPYSNIATSVAEAHREGLPSLPGLPTWRERTRVAKAAGSEYLNAVFGWLPLVGEVHDVGHAAQHSRDILSQYKRDEGRNTRRSFNGPSTHSSSTTDLGKWTASYSPAGSFNFSYARKPLAEQGRLTRTIDISSRTWFVGAFTYSMSPFDDKIGGFDRYGAEADKLFGIKLTPDVLWELTPWSWAVDWFSNTGDVIHNFTSLSSLGLVLRYGYVMSEKVVTTTYSLSDSGLKGLGSVPDSKVVVTSKVRSEANPFGFGIGWEGLSPSQLAITAALGITRLL